MQTYWNGSPCKARRVRVIVGKAERATWWFANLEGQEREAVEIWNADQSGEQPFYIDNADGSGWAKVTNGRGSPQYGHKSLDVERVIGEADGSV